MNTPFLQASSTQVSASKAQPVNILGARASGSAHETSVSFQLTNNATKTVGLETDVSMEDQLLTNDALLLSEMTPISVSDLHNVATPSNPQLLSGGTISPVTLSANAASLAVSSLPEQPMARETLLNLGEAKLGKPLNRSITDTLYASSGSFSRADNVMHSATVLSSAGDTKSNFQVAAASIDQISQLSGSQTLKEVLPIAMATQSHAQAGTSNTPNTLHFGATTQVQSTEWASIKVDTGATKWGEQMMQVLHDRVTLQAQQNMQEAKIRLDPPELGKLNLIVRVEGDTLNVQINANAASTREALVQVSDRLRTELQNQNFLNVNVNVGSDDSNQQQTAQQELDEFTLFSARDTSQPDSLSNLSEHWLSTQA